MSTWLGVRKISARFDEVHKKAFRYFGFTSHVVGNFFLMYLGIGTAGSKEAHLNMAKTCLRLEG